MAPISSLVFYKTLSSKKKAQSQSAQGVILSDSKVDVR